MRPRGLVLLLILAVSFVLPAVAGADPVRTRHGMVVCASPVAAQVAADVLKEGGNAVDAAVAASFALAVVYPCAGNIGGGGFLVHRAANGEAAAYDFREAAPARAGPTMFLRRGRYDEERHHSGLLSAGVPGTVAGLHMAWLENGSLPWPRLVGPAVQLAREGFVISPALAQSLREVLEDMKPYPASLAQFSRDGRPYEAGEVLRQPDLASTLERIAARGPAGFYEGETARLIAKEMKARGGWITADDLKAYHAHRREPVRGAYRGYEIISMPPPSSGGTVLIEMLNILEGFDLAQNGYGSARNIHLAAEAMRRAFADRARYMGDPDFNPHMPLEQLLSCEHARDLRATINPARASVSLPTDYAWDYESEETTHISVVDESRNAVSLTYTLEEWYGSGIVVPGAGFLLNNEMGDFNAGPGLTTESGLIGTDPNLAQPGKRMLSSMSPTIVARGDRLFMVTGSPGGRTIINTVLLTILNVVDFGMNAQQAVDAPRFHHQWLPDQLSYEPFAFSSDTMELLRALGHTLKERDSQGVAAVILYDAETGELEAGVDAREPDMSVQVGAKPAAVR